MNIGIDMLAIDRVASILKYEKTLADIFTEEELVLAARYEGVRKKEFFAGRLAVKEAVIKALGAGGDIKLTDITTLAHDAGKPFLRLYGAAEQISKNMGVTCCHVSISHSMEYAIAMVVLT